LHHPTILQTELKKAKSRSVPASSFLIQKAQQTTKERVKLRQTVHYINIQKKRDNLTAQGAMVN